MDNKEEMKRLYNELSENVDSQTRLFPPRKDAPTPVADVHRHNELLDSLEDFKTSLAPVTDFFAKEVAEPKKRISAKQRKQMEKEEYEKQMDLKARALITKKKDK